MEWKGMQCGMAKPKALVVSDQESWEKLWREALRREAPAVDWSAQFAVAVFAGARPTGGYEIELGEPVREGGRTVIRYRIAEPEPGMFVIQAFTQPYHIRLFHGAGGDVELRPAK